MTKPLSTRLKAATSNLANAKVAASWAGAKCLEDQEDIAHELKRCQTKVDKLFLELKELESKP